MKNYLRKSNYKLIVIIVLLRHSIILYNTSRFVVTMYI